jgi:hypothetical protein
MLMSSGPTSSLTRWPVKSRRSNRSPASPATSRLAIMGSSRSASMALPLTPRAWMSGMAASRFSM